MSIASQVRSWLKSKAYIAYCLKLGLINRSALARLIANELGISGERNFDAIHMAIRRFEDELPKERPEAEEVVKQSRLEIKTGIGVAIGRENSEKVLEVVKKARTLNEEVHFLQEPGVWVVVAPMHIISKLEKFAFEVHRNVVELVVKSPPAIESTPGVLAELVTRLANAGVNIIEVLSCWTDTIFVIAREDLERAVEALGM